MCIIFHSKNKKSLPKLLELEAMYYNNPDGMGLAIRFGKRWEILKGLVDASDLKYLHKDLQSANEIVGHFRFATHGEISDENCHPFAVSECAVIASKCESIELGVLFHNGVIQGFGSETLSDTLHFTTSVLARCKDSIPNILQATTGKFVYISPSGQVHRFGLTEFRRGLWVSNVCWSPKYNLDFMYWDKKYWDKKEV
jgi:predicted glutamine amidotransferase